MVSKQFYRDWINIDGFLFPSEIIQITYIEDKEFYKVTTFKDIEINVMGSDKMYDYKLPSNK